MFWKHLCSFLEMLQRSVPCDLFLVREVGVFKCYRPVERKQNACYEFNVNPIIKCLCICEVVWVESVRKNRLAWHRCIALLAKRVYETVGK